LLTRLDDHAAFAELVARHGPMVWNVCRNLLGEADAEDAFQATFLALLRATVRDGGALASWLHGVALRVSLAARREAGRRRCRERVAAVPEATREADDWADTMVAVHREVALLPDADRVAFVLCVLEGLTQVEAAARLGRTPGTVAGQVARAKKRLVERLTQRGVVPGLTALGTASVAGAVPPRLMERALGLPGAASPAVFQLARGALGMTTLSTKAIAAAVMAAVLAAGVLAAQPDGRRPPESAGERLPDPPGVLPAKQPQPDAGKVAARLEAKVHGFWNGRGDCQGDVTFKADGTYSWTHFGPGAATVAGKWSMRWDALPPTLVMTSTASTDKDYIGATAEVKVLQLDGKTLVYEQNGYKVEFTREARREQEKERDATLLRGQWKVVTEEYRDGTKWASLPVPADFAFAFSADGVTVIREKTSLSFSLTLKPDEKVMNLVRAEGGIDKLSQVIYRLLDDRLWICVVSGNLLLADAKAGTLRQYHLQRVVEPKK
jgi:RNA polymerase sigma factor (sigma-70 family)